MHNKIVVIIKCVILENAKDCAHHQNIITWRSNSWKPTNQNKSYNVKSIL